MQVGRKMGRWAKSHDQRKGQWLYNKLRPNDEQSIQISSVEDYNHFIGNNLFNMSNKEFDLIMENYPK